jgi:hypothetical protein
MTVHIVADAEQVVFLWMSAATRRSSLPTHGNGCSPIVATGDEDGTVQTDFEITESGLVLFVLKLDQQHALHRRVIDQRHDLNTTVDELLADLGS